jgi:hypothetical protein
LRLDFVFGVVTASLLRGGFVFGVVCLRRVVVAFLAVSWRRAWVARVRAWIEEGEEELEEEEPLRLAARATSPRGRGEGQELSASWAAVRVSVMRSRRMARDWVLRFELMVFWRVALMDSMAAVACL